VAINDVLPLKAARRNASANFKSFSYLIWTVHLYSLCGAALFGSHQRHLPPSIWQSLVVFRLLTYVCNAWQAERRIYRGRV